jgi:hypothetical protein
MIFDNYISFSRKVVLATIVSGIWIYFRTAECYDMIPRGKLLPVLFVMCWTYINYYEPLFLPLGLASLALYPRLRKFFFQLGSLLSEIEQ